MILKIQDYAKSVAFIMMSYNVFSRELQTLDSSGGLLIGLPCSSVIGTLSFTEPQGWYRQPSIRLSTHCNGIHPLRVNRHPYAFAGINSGQE